MNVRIIDINGQKPSLTQWDVDRVLYVEGCATKPMLHFWNDTLTRAIVVEPEADGSRWVCKVPNILLQHFMPIAVSVFVQEEDDEGKTVASFVLPVRPKKKPQDYTYEENIGYVNWVEKSEEAQELLDDIEDLRDEIQTAVDTATSASEAAVAAAEDIDETVAAALQAAKDSGEFDGADGRDGQDGAPGPKGDAGEDGVSPRFSSEVITGGHRIAVHDAYGDYTFDVMDGAQGQQGETGPQGPKGDTGAKGDKGDDGQDAVVDATLSVAGEAADAKATGDELHRHYLELTALSPEIRADTYAWNLRKNYNGSGSYVTADGFGITSNYIPVQPGARVQNTAPERDGNGKYTAMHINEFAGTTWLRRTILASGKYLTIGADATSIRIAYGYASNQGVTITQELIDATFSVRIIQQPASGSGGGGITVDDALSGSSANPVQNKIIKAALDGKGTYSKPASGIPKTDMAEDVQASLDKANTALQEHQSLTAYRTAQAQDEIDQQQNAAISGKYSKPSGGIPKSDLAAAVQTSLGKADTALQSAPVTSVNGQTGAVSLSIPTTASDVGAVAANQGVANANKVLTVNPSGVVVPEGNRFVVTLTPTAQDFSGVMDKTVAEIDAAYKAGKKVVFKVLSGANEAAYADCTAQYAFGSYTYPSFNGYIISDLSTPNLLIFAYTDLTNDGAKVTYSTHIYPLGDVFVATYQFGQANSCDKTYAEIMAAWQAGKTVIVRGTGGTVGQTANVYSIQNNSMVAILTLTAETVMRITHTSADTITWELLGIDATDIQGLDQYINDKGYYAKPAGGIPASDLAETYLTQHQDISGKLDKDFGAANADKFLVVGSDGMVTAKAMTNAETEAL